MKHKIEITDFSYLWKSEEIKPMVDLYKSGNSNFRNSGQLFDKFLGDFYKFDITTNVAMFKTVYIATDESSLALFMLKYPDSIGEIIPYE